MYSVFLRRELLRLTNRWNAQYRSVTNKCFFVPVVSQRVKYILCFKTFVYVHCFISSITPWFSDDYCVSNPLTVQLVSYILLFSCHSTSSTYSSPFIFSLNCVLINCFYDFRFALIKRLTELLCNWRLALLQSEERSVYLHEWRWKRWG